MEIDIIGAGPAGCYSAYLLAKKGHSVRVYEKKPKIGEPVQCTGILSDHFQEILPPKKSFVLNEVTRTRIHSPNGKYLESNIKKNFVVCRKRFDSHLAKMAEDAGAKIFLKHSFKSFEREKGRICSEILHFGKRFSSESDILIGADGPLSPVAKASGLCKERKVLIGTQVEAMMENDNIVDFYPFIGCYAWVVPVDKKTVRIGVASYKDSPGIFKSFAERILGNDYEKKIIEHQSGIIPLFDPNRKVQSDNIYIVGDAAASVKATSGGGINQSLKSASILAECIDGKKDYQKEFTKKIFLELYVHLLAHKMHLRFSDEEWDYLIDEFSKPDLKRFLMAESRDKIIKMMASICIARPSLIFRYIKYFPFTDLAKFRF